MMTPDSMLHARPLPAGAVGPGSQPDEPDGAELQYLSMPGAMQTYRQPPLPEPEEVACLTEGLSRLRALRHLLGGYRIGALPQMMDLGDLDAANLRLVEDSLGEGEVSILSSPPPPTVAPGVAAATAPLSEADPLPGWRRTQAQETRLAGVWRVRVTDDAGRVRRDVLEISDVPGFVHQGAFDAAYDAAALPSAVPEGVMNAPGVLAEVNEYAAMRGRESGVPAHIINLTLLPQSEQDLAFLAERLGTGSVSILSRGYGNCRITSTGLRDVWWVQFYNSDDKLILNTLEITDVPAAALAAQEDINDSAARLREILEALQ